MSRLFKAGLDYTTYSEETEFYFRDFTYYHTVLASKYSLLRHPGAFTIFWLVLFYLGSMVLFCDILRNEDVCPSDKPFIGRMTSMYFASVTMSTVGYGDISLYSEDKNDGMIFLATVYILVAIVVAYTVFQTGATAAFNGIFVNNMFASFKPNIKDDKDTPLYKQVRRLVAVRVSELVLYFVILNGIGFGVATICTRAVESDDPDHPWSLMTTLYWTIQSVTTIGYGDVNMPQSLRWFNIFFLTFGTAFAGMIVGSLAGLKDEVEDHRRYYAWRRREISKIMIDELEIREDGKLHRYEFVLGSLLVLEKVKTKDIVQIMDKFRELACGEEFICSPLDIRQHSSPD